MAFIQFLKPKNRLEEGGRNQAPMQLDEGEPEKNCPNCHKDIPISRLAAADMVCRCGYHFRLLARQRIEMLTDRGSFRELYKNLSTDDPLQFPGYRQKLKLAASMSNEQEGVLCGTAKIYEQACCLFVMDPYFMMGSMGTVVGEKVTRLFEYAAEHSLPVVGYTVSGGARMQEGILSLMQMAKTSGAVKRHSDAGNLYITVLTDPTTGGVTASFAMEGDIILAEPGALIGFAGPRVIEQTIRKKLPDGFQRAEFLVQRGFVDRITPRASQKKLLTRLLMLHERG